MMMSEPKKKIPITELPIRVFREIGGKGQHAAVIDAGTIRITFIADGAMESRRKAKDWARVEHDKMLGHKKAKAKAEVQE